MIIPKPEKDKIKRQVKEELKSIKENIVFLIDTREQEDTISQSLHKIMKFLDNNGFKYERKKLDCGDFSFVYMGEDYSPLFSIDRKESINEFVHNFFEIKINERGKKESSGRLKREIERTKGMEYFSFCIEHGILSDLYRAKYNSKASVSSVIGMIETIKNQVQVDFIEGMDFSEYLVTRIYYYLRSRLINQKVFEYEAREILCREV